jgi:DNA-binding response OmpR family regulator
VDGFETLSRLHSALAAKKVPIMILTAKPNIDDMQRALLSGASDYLTKPVDAAVVVERIGRRIGRPMHLQRKG